MEHLLEIWEDNRLGYDRHFPRRSRRVKRTIRSFLSNGDFVLYYRVDVGSLVC